MQYKHTNAREAYRPILSFRNDVVTMLNRIERSKLKQQQQKKKKKKENEQSAPPTPIRTHNS